MTLEIREMVCTDLYCRIVENGADRENQAQAAVSIRLLSSAAE